MRILLFTSNAIRHKFVANTLAKHASNMLTISECRPSDEPAVPKDKMDLTEKHFNERYLTEQLYFKGNDAFEMKTFPMIRSEINLPSVLEAVKEYKPEAAIVFGASIIREPLLSHIPQGRFINMHLGLSPYYRGSGTNFWPFVNKELQYVGATLLHIDPGVDTGEIIAHVRPEFEIGDTVHTVGCKTIQVGVEGLVTCLSLLKKGRELNRVKQWEAPDAKFYKKADFNETVLRTYLKNLNEGVIEKYLNSKEKKIRLIG